MRKLVLFLVKIVAVFAAGVAIAETVSRVHQPEPTPGRMAYPGDFHALADKEGWIYRVTVAPEIDLPPLGNGPEEGLVVPVTVSIDNNTYQRQCLPGKVLHWAVKASTEGGSTLAEDSGTVSTQPDEVLPPGGRWMRFVPVTIRRTGTAPGSCRMAVGLGWTGTEELNLQIRTGLKAAEPARESNAGGGI
jgi:hypothetical protein